MSQRNSIVVRELKAHLPYSVGSVLLALALVSGLTWLTHGETFDAASEEIYHIAHQLHLVLSAAATAAMFWGYQRRIVKTVVVSFIGALGLCTLSDMAIPHLGGLLFSMDLDAHLCIVEHAYRVIPFVIIGIAAGIGARRFVERATLLSHSGHVVVSSLASVLYLASYGGAGWIDFLPLASGVVFLAVLIPCCLSDIVVPLLFVDGEHLESCLCHHHGHPAKPQPTPDPEKVESGRN